MNTPMINDLRGKTSLVTGAGDPRGIGWACAIALAESGASVAVTDLAIQSPGLEELAGLVRNKGRKALALEMDITDCARVDEVFQEVAPQWGGLDVLVNNAGVGIGAPSFLDNSDDDWETSFRVNVGGLINTCRAALPLMQERGGGAIVNVSSLAGLRQVPSMPPPYTASKYAVVGITKAIAQEFGSDNIRCNAVCPGSVDTQMRSRALELIAESEGVSMQDAENEENAVISLGRPAQSFEVAAAVAFLASPASRYLTGVALPVDGGWMLGL